MNSILKVCVMLISCSAFKDTSGIEMVQIKDSMSSKPYVAFRDLSLKEMFEFLKKKEHPEIVMQNPKNNRLWFWYLLSR